MDTDIFNIVLEDNEGKTINGRVVAKWHDINDYIAYTTDNKTNNKLDLFVNKYIKENNTLKLETIVDDEEWNRVNAFLIEYLYEGEVK